MLTAYIFVFVGEELLLIVFAL